MFKSKNVRYNKSYAKKLTKRRKKLWKIKVIIISLLLTAVIIGISNLWERSIQSRVDETIAILTAPKEEPAISIWQQINDITGGENVNILYNLAKCESGLNQFAVGVNVHSNGTSYDRGFMQISNIWHPEVSDNCAFDFHCSVTFANNMINEGQGHQWTCWDRI